MEALGRNAHAALPTLRRPSGCHAGRRGVGRLVESAAQSAKADGEIPSANERGPFRQASGGDLRAAAIIETLKQGIEPGADMHRDHGAPQTPTEIVPGEAGPGGEQRPGEPMTGQNQPDAGKQPARQSVSPILIRDPDRPHGGIMS